MIPRPRQNAFTIIELIVAIGITSLLLFLINNLFFQTTQAVTQGIQTSQVTAGTRTLGDQFQRDAKRMLGPSGPSGSAPTETGLLVILQYIVDSDTGTGGKQGVAFDTRTGPIPAGDPLAPLVRSDQLLYFIDANGLNPLTPQSDNHFATTPEGSTPVAELPTPHGMLWYGHLRETQPDGSDGVPVPAHDLGMPNGRNAVATYWALGRQATLFAGNATNPVTTAHVNGYDWNDLAVGYTTSLPTQKFRALSDVSNLALIDVVGPTGNLGTNGADPFIYNFPNDPPYRNATYLLTYGTQRLRYNPTPIAPYESWQVAQMHPLLVQNVSDFIVEFAGDYHTGSSNDGIPDGVLDFWVNTSVAPNVENIKWYGYFYNEPNEAASAGSGNRRNPANPTGAALAYDASRPDVFDAPTSVAQQYINETTTLPTFADAAFVFRHNDDEAFATATAATASRWPALLRIRYRLHDSRGRLQGIDGLNNPTDGIWFEHIIRVNRP